MKKLKLNSKLLFAILAIAFLFQSKTSNAVYVGYGCQIAYWNCMAGIGAVEVSCQDDYDACMIQVLPIRWATANLPSSGIIPLSFIPGSSQTISVGILNPSTNTFNPIGDVTAVSFYVVRRSDFNAATSISNVNWELIGSGTFNATTNLWSVTWTVPLTATPSPGGYVLLADFFSPSMPNGGNVSHLAFSPLSPSTIPSISQWGLAILALLSIAFGFIFISKKQQSISFAGGMESNYNPSRSMFDKLVFLKVFSILLGITIIVQVLASLYFGSLTMVDSIGSICCTALISYIVHIIVIQRSNTSNS